MLYCNEDNVVTTDLLPWYYVFGWMGCDAYSRRWSNRCVPATAG